MVWPVPPLPTTRTNTTPQLNNHVADHNALADGLNEVAARLLALIGSTPVDLSALPQGLLARVNATGATSGIGTTATQLNGLTYSWTADPTRWYRTTAFAVGVHNNAGQVQMLIYDQNNITLRPAIIETTAALLTNTFFTEVYESGLSGPQTRRVMGRCVTAGHTCQFTSVAHMSVEDLGAV